MGHRCTRVSLPGTLPLPPSPPSRLSQIVGLSSCVTHSTFLTGSLFFAWGWLCVHAPLSGPHPPSHTVSTGLCTKPASPSVSSPSSVASTLVSERMSLGGGTPYAAPGSPWFSFLSFFRPFFFLFNFHWSTVALQCSVGFC